VTLTAKAAQQRVRRSRNATWRSTSSEINDLAVGSDSISSLNSDDEKEDIDLRSQWQSDLTTPHIEGRNPFRGRVCETLPSPGPRTWFQAFRPMSLYKDQHESFHPPLNLPPMCTHGAMSPRSGLTYIIVNKKTRLVLDDSVSETGFVSVNNLSENDTQKV